MQDIESYRRGRTKKAALTMRSASGLNMVGQSRDRDILVPAVAEALARLEERERERTILGSYPPDDAVVAPLAAAIEKCEVYKTVAGHSAFSGYSGVVLDARPLSVRLLYRADRQDLGAGAATAAANWLIRTLETRKADGTFIVVIWGLSVDREVKIAKGMTLIPFNRLSESYMKRKIAETAERTQRFKSGVWSSHNLYDLPGAAIVRRVANFPYIGSVAKPFGRLSELEAEARAPLAFLQTCVAGEPLVAGSWFEYEDQDLDFNAHENLLVLFAPEVVPHVPSHVSADPDALAQGAAALWSLPQKWQNDLQRSMERFTLSQCRHQIVDQVLDLAIAFEIATHGDGYGPINWKAAVRSAQLVGGSLSHRQKNRRAIEELFQLRGSAAHGGGLKASKLKKHETVLSEARSIYRAALAALLSLGVRPDWKTLELEPRTRE
jgi:hypothetical protein